MSDRNQNLVSPNVRYKNLRCSTQNKNLSDRKLPGLTWKIFLSDRMSDKFKKFSRSLYCWIRSLYQPEKLPWRFQAFHEVSLFKVVYWKVTWPSSDVENSRSACFDWHNFIRIGIKYEILLHLLLFGLTLFFKFLILTCLLKKISASLALTHVE